MINRRFTVMIAAAVLSAACARQPSAARPAKEPDGRFVVVNGHKLWYRTDGSGAPLLLIAGGPGMSHRYLYPALSRVADTAQVIYFDAFGRGQSERAKTPDEYSFDHDIDEVEGLRVALGLNKIVVYGQSYGGMVAQGYVLKYPASVSKLVLADTLYSSEMWQKGNNDHINEEIHNQYPEVWAELQALRAKGKVTCDAEYQKAQSPVTFNAFYFFNPSRPDLPLDDLNNDVYCQIAGRDADVTLGGDMTALDFRPRFREIKVPTLILTSRFDRVVIPRYALEYRTLLPAAEFVLFDRSGHFPFIEEPERHDAVLRAFLKR